MFKFQKAGAAMLIAGGAAFGVLISTALFLVIPLDFMLNAVISVGNLFAIKKYKDDGAKLAGIASILLLVTEAAWIAFPVLVFIIKRYTRNTQTRLNTKITALTKGTCKLNTRKARFE